MNEVYKISHVKELRSELEQQIEEAKQIVGYHDITHEKFIKRYFTRMKIARIEGKSEKDVIKDELDLISRQEEKFFYKVSPDMSEQRIFLYSREELLSDSNLDPVIASSSAHIREADRIDAIRINLNNNFGKKHMDLDDALHVSENIKDVSIFLRARGKLLLAQASQHASQKPLIGK